ncbi:MAG: hypothetical protein IJD57_00470 [Candidatus Gastranaerophilales bacterium]|nr:hypothetical protein [Candidatus Gastranaerophilales bacterium]
MATALSGTTITKVGKEVTGVLYEFYDTQMVYTQVRATSDNLIWYNSTYDGWVLRYSAYDSKGNSGVPSPRYGALYGIGFIYHYCIVDEGSSSGGGGGATGSVNFIIKATS